MERKGMIFPDILRNSLIFSRNDRENDRKQPQKWVIQLEVEE